MAPSISFQPTISSRPTPLPTTAQPTTAQPTVPPTPMPTATPTPFPSVVLSTAPSDAAGRQQFIFVLAICLAAFCVVASLFVALYRGSCKKKAAEEDDGDEEADDIDDTTEHKAERETVLVEEFEPPKKSAIERRRSSVTTTITAALAAFDSSAKSNNLYDPSDRAQRASTVATNELSDLETQLLAGSDECRTPADAAAACEECCFAPSNAVPAAAQEMADDDEFRLSDRSDSGWNACCAVPS